MLSSQLMWYCISIIVAIWYVLESLKTNNKDIRKIKSDPTNQLRHYMVTWMVVRQAVSTGIASSPDNSSQLHVVMCMAMHA